MSAVLVVFCDMADLTSAVYRVRVPCRWTREPCGKFVLDVNKRLSAQSWRRLSTLSVFWADKLQRPSEQAFDTPSFSTFALKSPATITVLEPLILRTRLMSPLKTRSFGYRRLIRLETMQASGLIITYYSEPLQVQSMLSMGLLWIIRADRETIGLRRQVE